jgi:methionyl aminopeptidase
MTILKTKEELDRIRSSGKVIRDIFDLIARDLCPGVSTAEIDRKIEKLILKSGAEPAFKGYKGYPSTICASVNDVVVHGIPSDDVVLRDGDIVGVDVGVKKNGFFADAARTFPVGRISREAGDLIDVTRESLMAGIKKAVAGNRLSDISNAIQNVARRGGYREVRAFVGHGIGENLHESPEVPNWGEKGKGLLLKEGLVLAIEPMLNVGTRDVRIMKDGWTAVTADRKLSAHFENTVIVGMKNAEIIT